jgi:hypothetical protein
VWWAAEEGHVLTDLDIDTALCRAFRKRPGESLGDAARRAMRYARGNVRLAAQIVCNEKDADVWIIMRRAHAALTLFRVVK